MTTPREIIAEAIAGDDWRTGEYQMGMRAPRPADELNNGSRFHADKAIESLTAGGFHIVRKDRFDAMHRRAQVAEGLLSAITHELEMWNHCLQDTPKWLDTWLFRNALGRLVRLRGRALAKAERASAGFHILSDADLQARDDAVMERAKIRTGDVVFHVPSREEWVVAWADYQSGYMAPCGWPESQAKIADCILTRRATDEESEKLISDVEKSGRRDSHKPAAIRAMQGGKP